MNSALFRLMAFLSLSLNAQETQIKSISAPPLDIPLLLAGNFGELRPNHFHSGVDIKTQGREGLPVFAIGEGSVARIVISPYGYGKVIYVAHPNGHTSVYAHLQKFAPSIESYIKKIQYQKQSFEIEVFPKLGEIKVQQGEVIAFSGNTGSSAGPHLHFEIRNSLTENPINPLLHGLEIDDTTVPIVNGLYVYPLADGAQVKQSNDRVQLRYTKQSDGSFLADKVNALGTIGFGFTGFDRQDLAANQNGIYEVQQLVNGKVYSEYVFDSFSFDETRYINTLIDYGYYMDHRRHIHKCFKDAGYKLSIYKTLYNDGKIEVLEGLNYTVELQLKDLANNVTKITIPVEGKREVLKIDRKTTVTDNFIMAKKPNSFALGMAQVYFPANTFYEDFYMDLQGHGDTLTLHNAKVPAHHNFTITFDTSKYDPKEKEQLFIGRLDGRNRPTYSPTHKRGNSFTTRTRNLGTYVLAKDSIAPTIRPKNFKDRQWLTNYRYLSLEIKDDLSGIDTYRATLNGQWILMEYEYKNNTLTYNFEDGPAESGKYELMVIVADKVGNEASYTATFHRK